eukprot:5501383-Prymnesium_polylepis.1
MRSHDEKASRCGLSSSATCLACALEMRRGGDRVERVSCEGKGSAVWVPHSARPSNKPTVILHARGEGGVLPAIELVHARHLSLLRLGQLAPRIIANHLTRLLRDHLSQDALCLARAVACIRLQRATTSEPRHRERLWLWARPRVVGVELVEHRLPSSEDIAQPRKALLLDGGGDGFRRAAGGAVGTAEQDGH